MTETSAQQLLWENPIFTFFCTHTNKNKNKPKTISIKPSRGNASYKSKNVAFN